MKKLCITLFLCILLCASMVSVTALFISGPSIQYDEQIEQQKNVIKQQITGDISSIERHVFRYITYIVATPDEYIWFNSDAKELLRREIDDIHYEVAIQQVMKEHELTDLKASLGYGFEQPIYVVENDDYVVLLDIDTLQEIYYQRK